MRFLYVIVSGVGLRETKGTSFDELATVIVRSKQVKLNISKDLDYVVFQKAFHTCLLNICMF